MPPVMPYPSNCTCKGSCPAHGRGELITPAPVLVLDDPELAKVERVRDDAQAAFEAADARWGGLAFQLHKLEGEMHQAEFDGRRLSREQGQEHEQLTEATAAAWQARMDAAEEAQRTRSAALELRARLYREGAAAW